ncbi:EMILIN-1-like [Saccostrea cucullata]|uniref:EMILIN-1-like n=1 Tax=Saccostrea cuccullata TaxID=36930 RepID=UPI002ED1EECE
MSTGEDMKRLENILAFEIEQAVRDSEEKMIKNMSATVTDLELRDRYLSLSLLDVHSNMTMFNHTLSQLKKQQERQEEQQNMTIHHLTHSLQKNTAKLSNILSHLHTRVAFTAGVGYFDKLSFAPSETIIFKQIIYQVGGGYNPMTGVFTAPKAGLYLIFSTAVSQRFNRIRTQFVINGSVKTGAMAQMDNTDFEHYLSTSNLVVHPLQVGDRVWIQMYQGKLIYAGYGETSFSVIMINGSQ